MANNITEYNATPGSNTTIDSISIDEGMAASNVNNAIRSLMSHLKNVDTGSQALTALSVTGALSAKGGAVFNEDSADVDFRVESNNQANMLLVDGGNDTVSFQPNSATLTIKAGSGDATNNVRLEASGTTSTFLEYRGFLGHQFYVDTTERLRIESSKVSVGSSTISKTSTGTIEIKGTSANQSIITNSDNSVSYANGATLDFGNRSGLVIVNCWNNGQIELFLCAGGAVVRFAGTGTSAGTISFIPSSGVYRWTNDIGSTATFTHTFIQTRNDA